MGQSSITVDELVSIAKEVEAEHPIDWGLLSIDEDDAYRLMAMHVIELFENKDQKVFMATLVKLIVENFVLHLKQEIINNSKNL